MHKRERSVSFYDLSVESSTRNSEFRPKQLNPGMALNLAREVAAMHRPTFTTDGNIQIALDDWEYVPGRREHYLLFNRADPNQSDVPFKNLKTGKARMAGKTIEEGIDLSSHLLVRLPVDQSHKPLVLMTGGTGLSAAKVCTALSRLLRASAKSHPEVFECDHPSGARGKKLSVTHNFALSGHQSKYLQQILKTGSLQGLELISEEVKRLDADFTITSTVIHCEPSTNIKTGGWSISNLKRSIKESGEPINKARVIFKEHGEQATQSQTFALADLDAAFVRKERILFDTDIFPRYEKINHGIIDKLRDLI